MAIVGNLKPEHADLFFLDQRVLQKFQTLVKESHEEIFREKLDQAHFHLFREALKQMQTLMVLFTSSFQTKEISLKFLNEAKELYVEVFTSATEVIRKALLIDERIS